MADALATPVAFLVFNRPDVTRRSFAAIRAARPKRLLVVADGARAHKPGEDRLAAEVRAITEQVDWPCEVSRNYASANMGCKHRVASGIDWVFGEVERAIIIEDDCVASPAFWPYAEAMLDRYVADRRVSSISGTYLGLAGGTQGHYFSDFSLMWGWATWADRWRDYRLEPEGWQQIVRRKWGSRPAAYFYWRKLFAELAAGQIDTWDYQWILTVWRQGGLAVRPSANLVENIGFGADATHTMDTASPLARLRTATAGDFSQPLTPVRADAERDAVDERVWAQIGWRSLVYMYLPFVKRLRRPTL
jgi:hypothetical protein